MKENGLADANHRFDITIYFGLNKPVKRLKKLLLLANYKMPGGILSCTITRISFQLLDSDWRYLYWAIRIVYRKQKCAMHCRWATLNCSVVSCDCCDCYVCPVWSVGDLCLSVWRIGWSIDVDPTHNHVSHQRSCFPPTSFTYIPAFLWSQVIILFTSVYMKCDDIMWYNTVSLYL